MLQHPSATRSIARLSVGRYRCPSGSTLSSRPPPYTRPSRLLLLPRDSALLNRRPTTQSPSPCAFYRRLCVLRQWQTDLNPPASPLSLFPVPLAFHLSYRGRRRRFSMTSQRALLFAPLNSYRSSGRTYMCICIIYICVCTRAKTHRLPMINVTSVRVPYDPDFFP